MKNAIGLMRQRVDVKNPTRASDGQGGYVDTFASASPATVWALIEPATANVIERQIANTIEAPISHLITIRYHAGVTTKTQLSTASATYAVRGLQNVELRNQFLLLACEQLP